MANIIYSKVLNQEEYIDVECSNYLMKAKRYIIDYLLTDKAAFDTINEDLYKQYMDDYVKSYIDYEEYCAEFERRIFTTKDGLNIGTYLKNHSWKLKFDIGVVYFYADEQNLLCSLEKFEELLHENGFYRSTEYDKWLS